MILQERHIPGSVFFDVDAIVDTTSEVVMRLPEPRPELFPLLSMVSAKAIFKCFMYSQSERGFSGNVAPERLRGRENLVSLSPMDEWHL